MANGRPGRIRSEESRKAILEATRDELAAQGYDRLSIDRIATAAGVGKQTVYRWYPSKSSLVADCVLHGYVIAHGIAFSDTGDARRDVAIWLQDFAVASRLAGGTALIRAGTAAAAEDAVIAERYAESTKVAEKALSTRLRAAIDAGQLAPTAPVDTLAEMIMGVLIYKAVARQELTPEFLAELLGIVFGPAPAPHA